MYKGQNYNNNLMREFSSKNNQNNANPMMNNFMLANNPKFMNYMNDNFFQDRVEMARIAKLDKFKQAKNIKELGMNDSELISYVINPIKIEKIDKKDTGDFLEKYNNKLSTYNSLAKVGNDKKSIVPKEIADLWNNRKNNPYKNILHFLNIDDYTKKNFKKENDLIIHKTTQLDKVADISKLKSELKKLEGLLFNHDKELKAIYTENKKKKFLDKFEYENKYKNKIKYDPKNCSELKELYKKEQKRIDKQNKRIDDMVEMLMASDELSKDELDEIQKIRDLDEKENLDYNKKREKEEEKLEKEIIEKIGKEEYAKLMSEMETNNCDLKDKYKNRNDAKKDDESQKQTKKIMIIKKNKDSDINNDKLEDKQDDYVVINNNDNDKFRNKYKNRN
jgi:hypothetical protein